MIINIGDGTVRVWNIDELKCDRIIHSCHDVGDVFSIVFTRNQLLFLGCQNTSIQWYDFNEKSTIESSGFINNNKNCQKNQFFNLFHDLGLHSSKQFIQEEKHVIQCVIRANNVYSNAHDGYIYCMTYAYDMPNLAGEVLITGIYKYINIYNM